MPVLETAYSAKPSSYFSGAIRYDYINELPVNPDARILEIGCGDGSTGALALKQMRCGEYYGVEIFPEAAQTAKRRLTEVLVGDVETIELPWRERTFDGLICSEVLEHLADPWAALRRIRPLMKSGARIFASSPNFCHHNIIRMLLRGEWNLTDVGVMDRTHLRWFTPKSYAQMFDNCGYRVTQVRRLEELGPRGRILSALTFRKFDHLLTIQNDLRAHC